MLESIIAADGECTINATRRETTRNADISTKVTMGMVLNGISDVLSM